MRMRRRQLALAVGVVASLLAAVGQADTLTYKYGYTFTGTQPDGTAPFITSTFNGSSGSVTLTMNASGLNSPDSIYQMYFNLAPSLNPGNLTFTYNSGVQAQSVTGSTDAYKADGDGKYDVLFTFKSGGGTGGFNATDTSTYTISGISSLSASSFFAASAPGSTSGGTGSYLAAAFVQNVGGVGNSSGWLAPGTTTTPASVPVPPAVWLFGSGLAGLVGVGRRRRT